MRIFIFSLVMFMHVNSVLAEELRGEATQLQNLSTQDKHAKFNYQMFCQGCHSPDGVGHNSVPTLKGSMHHFMSTQQGRTYLVQVPGSANSPLNDADLAELLNWMLLEFSSEQYHGTWRPYSEKEVDEYRKSPLFETIEYRKMVLENLQKK